jgi:chromosome segregation ATPase
MGLGKLNRRLAVMVARLSSIAETAEVASTGVESLVGGGARIAMLRNELAGVATDIDGVATDVAGADRKVADMKARIEALASEAKQRQHDGADAAELEKYDLELRDLRRTLALLEAEAIGGSEGEAADASGADGKATKQKTRGGGIFARLRVEAEETEAAVSTLRKTAESFREELANTKTQKYKEAMRALLGHEATSALIESYILQLAISPAHRDLNKAKQTIREWSTVDEGFFTWLESFFRAAHEAKRRMRKRGSRGNQPLGTDELNDLLGEVMGR